MNGIIPLDKPSGFTSQDAASKTRGILRCKVGHSGTLDPLATGVLPLFLGKATKAIPLMNDNRKSYIATVKTGIKTATGDITGEILSNSTPITDKTALENAMKHFVGQIKQIPPMYSAISVGGKRLYELAREGRTTSVPPRVVTIDRIELISFADGEFVFETDCGKGTYIRTLAEDICEYVGSMGTLTALRRTRSGLFSIEDCVGFDMIKESPEKAALPIQTVFADMPKLTLSDELFRLFINGVRLDNARTGASDGTRYTVYSQQGFAAVAEARDGLLYKLADFME